MISHTLTRGAYDRVLLRLAMAWDSPYPMALPLMVGQLGVDHNTHVIEQMYKPHEYAKYDSKLRNGFLR